jgi:hypothetical protein
MHQRFLATLAEDVRQQGQKHQLASLALKHYTTAVTSKAGKTAAKTNLLHVKGSEHCKPGEKAKRGAKGSDGSGAVPPPPPPPDGTWFHDMESKLVAFAMQLEKDGALDGVADKEDAKRRELDRLKYAVLIQKVPCFPSCCLSFLLTFWLTFIVDTSH